MNRSRGKRLGLLALCVVGLLLFTSLGVWQVQRLFWKRDLIERVEARRLAPPVPPPATYDPQAEYLRVQVTGVYDHGAETLVDALTDLGPGAWVITPLRTRGGGTVLVNRGFVPPERRAPSARVEGQVAGAVAVTGLLRTSEPDGRILRPNDPASGRWYSRDVAAIASRRDLPAVAPYFIDADAAPNPGGLPIGGLTVVRFRNAHLGYALTWFGLAALCVVGLVITGRDPWRTSGRK